MSKSMQKRLSIQTEGRIDSLLSPPQRAILQNRCVLSANGFFRYWLTRDWGESGKKLIYVMLNPSTADGEVDDPTIRRCMGFAKLNGYSGIIVINLYALRSPRPEIMLADPNREGLEQTHYWIKALSLVNADILLAWGAFAEDKVANSFLEYCRVWNKKPYCLGTNKDGSPKHPLYLKADSPFVPYGWS